MIAGRNSKYLYIVGVSHIYSYGLTIFNAMRSEPYILQNKYGSLRIAPVIVN